MQKPKNTEKLKGLEKITEFMELIFLSASIKGEKPLSCMIIAPVSSGKTTLVKQFVKNKNVFITTDSTAYGLLKNYQNQLKNGEIRHIIVPDLLNSLARKKTTADQLLMLINATSEDGLFPSKTYGLEITDYINPFGWVLCLTTEGFKRKERFLQDIGFNSRFFVLKYKYSLEQIETILNNIVDEHNIIVPNIDLTCKSFRIKGNKEIFKELIPFSKLLCKESDSEVLRMQKKLQTLVKAHALKRGDKEIKTEDLNKIKELIELIK